MSKLELTKEMKEELHGLMPISCSSRISFTPAIFKKLDESMWPVFILRKMTKKETMDLRRASGGAGDSFTNEDKVLDIIRKCVLGWSNMYDGETGEEILFAGEADGCLTKDLWDMLPLPVITAVMNKVSVISGLIEAEKRSLK
jgi:hypothetical protein